jgi:hypothetical protein
MFEWMRVYKFTLVVDEEDMGLVLCWLADRRPARWVRLAFPRFGLRSEYEQLWHAMFHMAKDRPSTPAAQLVLAQSQAVLAIRRELRAQAGRLRFLRCDEWCDEEVEHEEACDRFYATVTDVCVAHLGDLHTLDLSTSMVTDVGVAYLSNLHTLDLCHTRGVTDVGLAHLSNLHTLSLKSTGVTDVGVAHLSNLHTLDVRHTKVTGVGVARLSGLCTLRI